MTDQFVLDEAQKYFQSVNKMYHDTNIIKKGNTTIKKVYSVSGLFFSLSLIPIIPSILAISIDAFDKFNIVKIKPYFSHGVFETLWPSCIIITFLCWAFINWLINKKNKRNKKNILDSNIYKFATIYNCLIELESYELNALTKHLENMRESFYEYTHKNESIEINPSLNLTLENPFAFTHRYESKFDWFEVSYKTKVIATALSVLRERVFRRIDGQEGLNHLVLIFKHLVIYEFVDMQEKTKKSVLLDKTPKIKHLEEASLLINALPELPPILKDVPQNYFKICFSSIVIHFKTMMLEGSFFVMLLYWFVFVGALLWSLAFVTMPILKMNLNQQIYIGLLTAPVAGAIAISVSLHKKKTSS